MSEEQLIALFHKEKPSEYTLKSIRLEDEDSRWILSVCFGKERYVIKIASNGFTTSQRVNGWVNIIGEYKKWDITARLYWRACPDAMRRKDGLMEKTA